MEIWKDIPDHVGYQVSNLGRFRSCYNNGGKMTSSWRMLSLIATERGYRRVMIRKNKKPRIWFAHRLVMLAFVGYDKREVNHINFVKHDNRLENLEYVTRSENEIHSYKHGIKKKKFGSMSHYAKLSEEQAIQIKYKERGLQYEIAKKYGISKSQVCNIKNGRSWPHI